MGPTSPYPTAPAHAGKLECELRAASDALIALIQTITPEQWTRVPLAMPNCVSTVFGTS